MHALTPFGGAVGPVVRRGVCPRYFFTLVVVVIQMVVPYLFTAVVLENYFDAMEVAEQEEVRRTKRPK